jgi:integrase
MVAPTNVLRTTKFNFTKQTLEKLSLSSNNSRAYFYDLKVRGLGVSITSKGTITFIVYRKISGKPERVTLGRYPDLSIENARNMALEVNSQFAQGKSPAEEKRKAKAELRFQDVFAHYLEKHAKVHKKSWKNDEDQYKLYLARWKNRKLSTLTQYEIESLHSEIGKNNGLYAANRVLALISVVFRKAIDWGWISVNPAIGVKKFKEKSRDRFLHGGELPRFFKALTEEPSKTMADFFMISLLTGARKENVLSMQWKDINFDNRIWTIPDTKNGESLKLPLSVEVADILQSRLSDDVEKLWVFPSKTSKSGHLEEPKRAWKQLLQRAALEDLRLHDLRRTLGSWQAATGANSYVIGKSLGHKTQQATAIYARLNLDPVRESVNRATAAMFETYKKEI